MSDGEVYQHFSHEHPLDLVRTPTKTLGTIICSCCKLSVLQRSTPDFYSCKTCNFSLHRLCFLSPQQIQHPSHPNHSLSLLSSTPLTSICRACGEQVNGFHYHCGASSTSYHVLCSLLPQSVSVTSHSHPLKLEFSLPYDVCCDLCQKPALNTMWLYRCRLCEFDTHLHCAILRSRSKSGTAGVGEELMQLLSQKMETRVLVRRSSFPEENLRIEEGRVCMTPDKSHCTNPDPDQSGLVSIDMTPTQSCQFSESYFSIDLAKSYHSLTPNATPKQEKGQENKKIGSNKAMLVGINEGVFLDWGEPQSKKNLIEMDHRSKSTTKGSSFTSSGEAKPETWKKMFCCTA